MNRIRRAIAGGLLHQQRMTNPPRHPNCSNTAWYPTYETHRVRADRPDAFMELVEQCGTTPQHAVNLLATATTQHVPYVAVPAQTDATPRELAERALGLRYGELDGITLPPATVVGWIQDIARGRWPWLPFDAVWAARQYERVANALHIEQSCNVRVRDWHGLARAFDLYLEHTHMDREEYTRLGAYREQPQPRVLTDVELHSVSVVTYPPNRWQSIGYTAERSKVYMGVSA